MKGFSWTTGFMKHTGIKYENIKYLQMILEFIFPGWVGQQGRTAVAPPGQEESQEWF